MKTLLFLLAFLMCSCSKKQEQFQPKEANKTNLSTRPSAEYVLREFKNTQTAKEDTLLQNGTLALKEGFTLNASDAEKCYESENNKRPKVQEICLLLWAWGQDPSPRLEEILLLHAPLERLYAIAAIGRKTTLQKLPTTNMETVVGILKYDSLWLRAKAIHAWLEPHIVPSQAIIERFQPWLILTGNESPADVAMALKALHRLSQQHWQSAFAEYCHPQTEGEARIRCWRVIGAMVASPIEKSLSDKLFLYLPKKNENDWILFLRSFPNLAHHIRNQFPEENL